jgi:hypothetical protein
MRLVLGEITLRIAVHKCNSMGVAIVFNDCVVRMHSVHIGVPLKQFSFQSKNC